MEKECNGKPGKNGYRYPGNESQEVLVGIIEPLHRLFRKKIEEEPYQQKDNSREQDQQNG
jgi:hypothetical protein